MVPLTLTTGADESRSGVCAFGVTAATPLGMAPGDAVPDEVAAGTLATGAEAAAGAAMGVALVCGTCAGEDAGRCSTNTSNSSMLSASRAPTAITQVG
jgi:hypothetical protein